MEWQRYEHKYLVSEELARRVRAGAAGYVQPDAFAARRPGNCYPIASLYLDTPDLRLYQETVDGIERRYKLRVRSYSDDPESPLHFEIKRRHNGVVHKVRAAVPRTLGTSVLAGSTLGLASLEPRPRQVLLEFLALAQSIGATPRILVRYDREAYVGRFDPSIRMTFDRNLRTLDMREARVDVQRLDFLPVEGSRVVLEFKFDGRAPSWIHALVQRHELERLSFSKYGHSICRVRLRTLGAAP